ncbi:TerC family protein [Weissella thailandensis]|uniref:TerC family protein n=1 Tax=Weissella thailandensis TaxID=89061 RepID=UPI0027E4F5EC|nr:TerC family protein [Weissella thailandensis]
MTVSIWVWIGFFLFVIAMLALDLGVLNKKDEVPTFKKSLLQTAMWVVLAFIFAAGIWYFEGSGHAIDFVTGYLLEESLSMDNLFIFILVFGFFGIEARYQHRVLFWGIFGAIVMRLLFILVGAALLSKFEWLMYLFGIFLVYTGVKMLFDKGDDKDLNDSKIIQALRKVLPVKDDVSKPHFMVKENGKWFVTPFLIALIFIELSDILFAVDSIPAVLAVTQDTFIVVTSNIFAVLGLRSLFFALSKLLPMFRYIKYALALILAFIGAKMLINEGGKMADWHFEINNVASLIVIVSLLAIAIIASIAKTRWEDSHGTKN